MLSRWFVSRVLAIVGVGLMAGLLGCVLLRIFVLTADSADEVRCLVIMDVGYALALSLPVVILRLSALRGPRMLWCIQTVLWAAAVSTAAGGAMIFRHTR